MVAHKILVSACLLGEKVRYDGRHKKLFDEQIEQWRQSNLLVSICPEVAGGLPVPRPAAEIVMNTPNSLKVMNIDSADVTRQFEKGASQTLNTCHRHKIRLAILTDGSPSCGSQKINDGQFKGQKIKGMGVTTKLLTKNGIRVFNQYQLDDALEYFLTL